MAANMSSGLVTVRVSDHLPIFTFVGGNKCGDSHNGATSKRRLINERRIATFADELKAWSFDEVRSLGIETNVARFRNEFQDMYDTAFPWVETKKKKRDQEKPWLDDSEFKKLVKEKGDLYKKKLKNVLEEEELTRLKHVTKEVNRLRHKLKRDYFQQRLNDKMGDIRATWEVLGEALTGQRNRNKASSCGYFVKDGAPVTNGPQIAEGFCDFYCV